MESKNTLQAIVNKNISINIKRALINNNIKVYETCKVNKLNTSLSFHPDIQIHFLDKNFAVCAPEVYEYYKKILPKNIKLYKGEKNLSVTYPLDCAYNVARFGDYVIGNLNSMSSVIKEEYTKKQYSFIHVNQGYAKCNICIVNSHAIITEDPGIYSQISDISEIDCLYLNPGEIILKGYSHGFIGGASGNCEKSIYFCGNLKDFSQRKKLNDFLKKHNAKVIELSNDPLEDYGSIIFF